MARGQARVPGDALAAHQRRQRRFEPVLAPRAPADRLVTPSVLLDIRPLQGPDRDRGIGTYTRGLLGGLVAEGFDSQLAVLVDGTVPDPEVDTGRAVMFVARRRYHGRLAAFEDAVALGRDLARVRPRLYHAVSLSLPGSAPCREVVTVHDLIPWALGGPAYRGERIRFALARRLLRRATRVIAVSQATARDAGRIARLDARRIDVIPEAVDPVFRRAPDAAERVRNRWGIEGGFLLHVGALEPRRRPGALAEVFRLVRLNFPDVDLVLAGDVGPHSPTVDGARRLGAVTRAELVDLLSTAACLIFTSAYEGFGLPLLEAMACGCPVAAFDNSSVREVTGRAAMLAPDADVAALAGAVQAILGDAGNAVGLRQKGLGRAREFTWQKTARRTISTYERALA